MARRVLTIERSPLARNVYSMILSNLGEMEFINGNENEALSEIAKRTGGFDLIIANQSTLDDREMEFYSMLKNLNKSGKTNCVLLVRSGSKSDGKDFEKIRGIKILEKPFHPDEFLKVIEKMWGL